MTAPEMKAAIRILFALRSVDDGQIAFCGSGDTGSEPGAADSVTASSGGGGGGGGGCFIETSLNHPNPFIAILGILFCAAFLFMKVKKGGRKKAFKK